MFQIPHFGDLYTRGLIVCLLSFLSLSGCAIVHNIRSSDLGDVPSEDGSITVMTYNIRVGYGIKDGGVSPWELRRRKKNLPAVVAAIRSIDPDIIGLQEVLGPGQAQELAQALNMNYAYGAHPASSNGRSWWGLAVLSKYEILEARTIQISGKRSILLSTVKIDGQPVTFVDIHKDHLLYGESSFRNIRRAVDPIDGPVVLIGDLNVGPVSVWSGPLSDRFIDSARALDTAESRAPTFGTHRIDYVLVDPRFFVVQEGGLISGEHWAASDHRAYYARLRFKPVD